MTILPVSYGGQCTQKMLKIMNGNDSLEDDTMNAIKDGFEKNPDFRWVYTNLNPSNIFKTWITDGNTEDKILGHKMMFSYPYKPIKFNVGDYVAFDYYHVDDKVGYTDYENWSQWLLYGLDYQNYYNVTGKIFPCNEKIKWIDNNKLIHSYPCYFEDSMKNTKLDFGTKGIVESNADVVVYLQQNSDTETLYVNQRFLFPNNRAYVIIQKNIEINNRMIKLFLNKTKEQSEDDFDNCIAWNGGYMDNTVYPTETLTLLTPEISSIALNKMIDFSIFKYVNGVANSDTFTVIVSGVPNDYFELNMINGNVFTIKNLKQNNQIPILLTCTNNTTMEVTTQEMWLRGAF